MLRTLALTLIAVPSFAFAVGSNDDAADTPPTPTETSETCTDGQVWDADAEVCVDPDDQALNDEKRLNAIRELAYAGQIQDALRVLGTLEDQGSDGAMTYKGFLARQSGDWETAKLHYAAALAENPDNLLARSYYGQGLAAEGDMAAAKAQLSEIRARGGRQTWAEVSLRLAIETGHLPAY